MKTLIAILSTTLFAISMPVYAEWLEFKTNIATTYSIDEDRYLILIIQCPEHQYPIGIAGKNTKFGTRYDSGLTRILYQFGRGKSFGIDMEKIKSGSHVYLMSSQNDNFFSRLEQHDVLRMVIYIAPNVSFSLPGVPFIVTFDITGFNKAYNRVCN